MFTIGDEVRIIKQISKETIAPFKVGDIGFVEHVGPYSIALEKRDKEKDTRISYFDKDELKLIKGKESPMYKSTLKVLSLAEILKTSQISDTETFRLVMWLDENKQNMKNILKHRPFINYATSHACFLTWLLDNKHLEKQEVPEKTYRIGDTITNENKSTIMLYSHGNNEITGLHLDGIDIGKRSGTIKVNNIYKIPKSTITEIFGKWEEKSCV